MRGKLIANILAALVPSRNLRHRLRQWKGFETNYDRLKKDLDYIKDVLRYSRPPSACPPVQGIVRGLQLMIVEKFKQFAALCDANGIDYWLDYGTLLGAARHKGFVPWDEDFDLSVRYEDRERVRRMLDENGVPYEVEGGGKGLMRILVMEVQGYSLHIDIFSIKQVRNLTEESRNEIDRVFKPFMRKNPVFSENYRATVEGYLDGLQSQGAGNLVCYVRGADSRLVESRRLSVPEDMLFPLVEIEFEGVKCKAPAKYEEYLTDIYGDYMQWPSSLANNNVVSKMGNEARQEVIRNMTRCSGL